MSDVMLFGVLRMPYEMAMGSELSRFQFWQRAQEAADRISTDGVEINRLLALLSATQPAPASTGREAVTYVVRVQKLLGEWSDWETTTEETWRACSAKPRHDIQIIPVFAAPVAARELDVEAERRECMTALYDCSVLLNMPKEAPLGQVPKYLDEWLSAARNAAQGTQPESAQVSTEQAGDAWPDQAGFEVQARYQGATNFTLVHPDFMVCNNGWTPATYRDPMTELAWRVWANKRAPSPNNSPVGADKEPK